MQKQDTRHKPTHSARRTTGLVDFQALRSQVSIQDVLGLLGWVPAKRHGPQLRGTCPVHKSSRETSVVFAVHLEKNTWYCHSPKCKQGGNQLDLWMNVTGLPLRDAAINLCDSLGIEIPVFKS